MGQDGRPTDGKPTSPARPLDPSPREHANEPTIFIRAQGYDKYPRRSAH